mgnify:CR=1 FL=1
MPANEPAAADLAELLSESLPGRGTPEARLRSIPGDFDIDGPPLKTTVQPGESFAGWISRVAVRYDTPPRVLLEDALEHPQQRVTSTRAMIKALTAAPDAAARLGVETSDLDQWAEHTPLETAAIAYTAAYRTPTPRTRAAHRYCPACLANEAPYWRRSWAHPLTWVCVDHQLRLVTRCPECDREPFGTGAWVSRPVAVTECTHRQPTTPRRNYRKIRRPCGADLRQAHARQVSEVEVQAQQLLHALAKHQHDRFTMLESLVTGTIAFDAFLELIADQAGAPATAGPLSSRHIETTASILTAPTLKDAAAVLDEHDLLPPHGHHAPIGSASRVSARPHNPLLAAIQLTRHASHLSPTAQLTYRTASGLPRYPNTAPAFRPLNADSPANREVRAIRSDFHLLLPERDLRRQEPDPCWFPQALWPGAIPTLDAVTSTADEGPITRAAAALLAAKTGSLASWGDLALELALPRRATHTVTGMTRTLRRRGLWPDVIAEVDALVQRLQQTPPPINYRLRRVVGDDTALMDLALQRASHQQGKAPTPAARRRFWELFTGGDIAFASTAIALDPHSPAYAQFVASRAAIDNDHSHVFATAHGYLTRLRHVAVGGPLYWLPP